MGLLNSLLAILWIVLIIMTAIASPQVSISYYKEMMKSAGKLWDWSVTAIKDIISTFNHKQTVPVNNTKITKVS